MFTSVKLGADFSRGVQARVVAFLLFATRPRYPGIRGLTLEAHPSCQSDRLFRFACTNFRGCTFRAV